MSPLKVYPHNQNAKCQTSIATHYTRLDRRTHVQNNVPGFGTLGYPSATAAFAGLFKVSPFLFNKLCAPTWYRGAYGAGMGLVYGDAMVGGVRSIAHVAVAQVVERR
jgi:hypothetical protein